LFKIDKKILAYFDFIQPFLIVPIVVFSYVLISEANDVLSSKQVVYFGVGFAVFTLFFLFPIRKFLYLIPIFYWINIILLLSVDFFGVSKLGARRWLEIPTIRTSLSCGMSRRTGCPSLAAAPGLHLAIRANIICISMMSLKLILTGATPMFVKNSSRW